MNHKTYQFYISGMHCNACTLLTEEMLGELSGVTAVKADLSNHMVTVSGDFGAKTEIEVAETLSQVMTPHGYRITVTKESSRVDWSAFKVAVPVALLFVGLFIFLQKIGLVNLIQAGTVSYSTAALVGVVASLSTCMAVVGGLVISVSANFAKGGDKVRPQVLFHLGRIIGFFVLGGVVGLLGATIPFGPTSFLVISIVLSLVMLILGLNLLDIFPGLKKWQPTFSGGIGMKLMQFKKLNHTLTPALLGVITFFLPCGFTQSMQLYALTTGSFLTGSLIMLAFALGTLPVLALLSFGALGLKTPKSKSIFFKTAGLVVLFFALFNLLSGLTAYGLVPPIFNI